MKATAPKEGRTDARRSRIRFALVFAVVAGTLLTLYSFPYAEHGMSEACFARYLAAYTWIAGSVLHLADPSVHVTDTQLVGRISLTIAKNCDAMDVNILFAAAILAFPARWTRRAVGIAAGVAVLVGINVVRIVSLYYVGVHWPASFEFVHAEVWPFGLVVLAVSAFLVWSRWAGTVAPANA